jgi:hypothetical protein
MYSIVSTTTTQITNSLTISSVVEEKFSITDVVENHEDHPIVLIHFYFLFKNVDLIHTPHREKKKIFYLLLYFLQDRHILIYDMLY